MRSHNQSGVALLTVLILVVVFGLLIGGGFLLINSEKAKTRDAKRLSDMTRIQAAFEFLFNDTASYEGAAKNGCSQVGAMVSTCNIGTYIPTISKIQDPGKYKYTVSKVPNEEDYELTFVLEKNYGTFRSGQHTLTPQGIR